MKRNILCIVAVFLCTGCAYGNETKMINVNSKPEIIIEEGTTFIFPRQAPYRQYNAIR